MIIKEFSAKNFRNIEECNIKFSPGVNLLYGKNAQGKTNVIEGIYLFSRGKSFRCESERDLIRYEKEGFNLSIEYEDKTGNNSLEYSLYGKERKRKKNGYKINKLYEMIGSFKSVLFYPDDLGLVKNGPEERRNFINVAISQCFPSYIKNYADYKVALENRNSLLKFMQKGMYVDKKEFEAWSSSMAEYASFIYLSREDYIKRINENAKKILFEISDGKEDLSLVYKSNLEESFTEREKIREEYIKVFSSDVEREIAAGTSLFGPHRDDVEIYINGKKAKSFASQGQQRSIVLSLKLAEGEVVREICGEYPVFLFDDVLSELDEDRRSYVLSGIGEKQIIITACDPDECRMYTETEIDVSEGKYVLTHR